MSIDPVERQRVVEALTVLAHRFSALVDFNHKIKRWDDPAEAMEHLAQRVAVSRPVAERGGGVAAGGRGFGIAAHRRRDPTVRPRSAALPADFRRRSLASQVETFAWSFHGEDSRAAARAGPRPSPSEVVQAVGERLAVDGPVRLPLLPALADYRAFLLRLPRR